MLNPPSLNETNSEDQFANTEQQFSMLIHFIVECRGRGLCLSPAELELVRTWFVYARSFDELVLVLDQTLPEFFASTRASGKPKNLASIDKRVVSKLRSLASRSTNIHSE